MEQEKLAVTADFAVSGYGQKVKISVRTVQRMRWYLYALEEFARHNITTVASSEIAAKVGVKSGLVRKDLCLFGGFGRPSIGYNVAYLQKKIKEILRINQVKNVAWVGAQRLLDDPRLIKQFADNNCEIVAVFDKDTSKTGFRVDNLQVLDTTHMVQVVQNLGIDAAVISTPADDAQWAADSLVAGGVKAILNLTPVVLVLPPDVAVRDINIAGELMMLSYYCGNAKSPAVETSTARSNRETEAA